MDFTLQADFQELECHGCTNPLSYFPIHLGSDKANICGRWSCFPLLKKCYVQNVVYETLAQYVKFPCRYKEKGCSEHFLPKDIPNHEKTCDFQEMQCLKSDCQWKGLKPALLQHCQDNHPDIILNNSNSFEVDLSKTYQCENLLEYNSLVFIVKQKISSINKTLDFCIHDYGTQNEKNAKKLPYKVCFETNATSVEYMGSTNVSDRVATVKMSLDFLKDEGKIAGKIVFENDKDNAMNIQKKLNEEILNRLKCTYCQEFALPPIDIQEKEEEDDYSYKKYTIIRIRCSSCKNLQNTSSNEKIKVPGNVILDQVAEKLVYPCAFARNGCTFVAKPSEMKQHIELCPAGTQNCPLLQYNCKWKGFRKNVDAHIHEAHTNLLVN